MEWKIIVRKIPDGSGWWVVEYFGDDQYRREPGKAEFNNKASADRFAARKFKEIAIRFKLIKQSKEWVLE